MLSQESNCYQIDVGSEKKARVMDTSVLKTGFISCMSNADYAHFWELDNQINEHGNVKASNDAYEPM